MVRVLLATGVLAALLAPPAQAREPRRFGSCPALVRYASAHQPPVVARPGLPTVTPQASPGATPPADTSTTNVQEAGVDEPDIVKTDGSTLFVVASGTLYAIDARAATPHVVGSLQLPPGAGHELLVDGPHALVVSRRLVEPIVRPLEAKPAMVPPAGDILPYGPPTTTLTELDVSDPAAPKVVRTLTVAGVPVGARQTGATARVVISSAPWRFVTPQARDTTAGWIPTATLTGPDGASRQRLVGCRDVLRPPIFAGASLLTVLTVDLDRGLPAVDADAVMTDGQTVYASPTSLYVATQRWDATARSSTEIHRFSTEAPDATEYRGDGHVPGHLLDQFSLSEQDGVLRAATDIEDQGCVTTLHVGSTRLLPFGRVCGLGPGERIRAVRFLGDTGYVVTFRQTDPLYTIDLSDPSIPRVAGELELLGYSAYLHPLGDGLLLGVGQDADEAGRTQGLELSLFDVSDPGHPQRLAHQPVGDGATSDAEYDHHAFLWWPDTRLAVLPVSSAGFTGAAGFRVSRTGIEQAGRIAHAGAYPTRTAVVGPRLFTVSDTGVQVSALDTLGDEGWVALPPAATR